jgi:predicted AAA+ superfamily ATPase
VSFSLQDEETRRRETQALLDAANLFSLSDLTIVTWSEEEEIRVEGKNIKVVPVHKLCGLS